MRGDRGEGWSRTGKTESWESELFPARGIMIPRI